MSPSSKRRKTSASTATEPTTSNKPTGEVKESQYPGFEPWATTLEIDGGNNAMSKFDAAKSDFAHSAKIHDADAFKLKPLTITDGPLKGRHVLMLEPVNERFRFMDLPAELRNIIYDMLLKESKGIRIEKFVSKFLSSQRAVRLGFRHGAHEGMSWDKTEAKWEGQVPSAHSLLRVSRAMKSETARLAYGSNTFRFHGLSELKVFLDSIGTMRRFLRHIAFDYREWSSSLAQPAFHKLKDARDLKSLTFQHATVCNNRDPSRYLKLVARQRLVADLLPWLKALHKAQRSSDSPVNVLDIIHVVTEPHSTLCHLGKDGKQCNCRPYFCSVQCRDRKQHMEETQSSFRHALAVGLGIAEPFQ